VSTKTKTSFILSTKKNNFNDNFIIGEKLGIGSQNAEIYQVYQQATRQPFVIKIYPQSSINDDLYHLITAEGNIIKGLHLPHVVQYYGTFTMTMNNIPYIGILMSYVPGEDLFNYYERFHPLSDDRLVKMMQQTLIGLDSLHSLDIAHRDLKIENILYDGQIITIIDLGYACSRQPQFACTGARGTPTYISPELYSWYDSHPHPKTVPLELLQAGDVWALGVTFYSLSTGLTPFYGHNYYTIRDSVLSYPQHPLEWNPRTPKINKLVRECFKSYRDRPIASELLDLSLDL
jgi:serine/threonine protein kinase